MKLRDQIDKTMAATRVAWSLMTRKRLFGDLDELDGETRDFDHGDLVSRYYDQCTDVYRIGWGDQFHFAPFQGSETFKQAALSIEQRLASDLKVQPGAKLIDIGCGIGGPARNIAQFTNAAVTGVNICRSQVALARKLAKRDGMADRLHFVEADAMSLPFEDQQFDAAYSIEAICHVPDKHKTYGQCARVLKTGARFAGWDWVWTRPADNEQEKQQQRVVCQKHAMSHLLTMDELRADLESSGFEIISFIDLADADAKRGWWDHLEKKLKAPVIAGKSWIGDLIEGAAALISLGKSGLFSPLCYWVARKQ